MFGMIGILPRYNTMKCQLQINVRYLTRYMPQNVGYSPNKKISGVLPTTRCQLLSINVNVRYQVMLGTYPIAGMCETVRY